jgi:hypothetical protein
MSAINENNIGIIPITNAGGTVTIDCNDRKDAYIVIGNSADVILTAPFTIAASNQVIGSTIKIYWLANVDNVTNLVAVTVLGATLSNIYNTGNFLKYEITATFIDITGGGSPVWVVTANIPNASKSVDTTKIPSASITLAQMATLTAGKIVATDSVGNVTAVAVGSGYLVTFNGTQIVAVAVSGDVTMPNAGATLLNSRFKIQTLAIPVSWETNETGTIIAFLPYTSGVTITQIFAVVTKATAGTSGTIVLATQAGSLTTNNPITFAAQAIGAPGLAVNVTSGGVTSGAVQISATPGAGLTAGRVMLYLIFTIN